MRAPASDVTDLLIAWSQGNQGALDQLVPLVYGELRELAARLVGHERPDHTLQPTALVHEAFQKLVDQQRVQWKERAQFFAVAARIMRRILVDHARQRRAAKRPTSNERLSIDEVAVVAPEPDPDVIALNDALERLAALDARQATIVELRYFGGLTLEETAEVMNLSPATIKNEWQVARTWLFGELAK